MALDLIESKYRQIALNEFYKPGACQVCLGLNEPDGILRGNVDIRHSFLPMSAVRSAFAGSSGCQIIVYGFPYDLSVLEEGVTWMNSLGSVTNLRIHIRIRRYVNGSLQSKYEHE